jgi:hypothetical protein
MSTDNAKAEGQVEQVLSRDQILVSRDCEARSEFVEEWGGSVVYKPASVGDKRVARNMAMVPAFDGKKELDSELLEVALVIRCCQQPKFTEMDIQPLMEKSAKAISRLASLIAGTVDPRKRGGS